MFMFKKRIVKVIIWVVAMLSLLNFGISSAEIFIGDNVIIYENNYSFFSEKILDDSKANTIITLNRYYSEYDSTKFYSSVTPSSGTQTNLIRYRMNCYGYAFCNILYGNTYVNAFAQGYKQQPGEFAKTVDKCNTVNNVVVGNSSQTMTNVVSNMQLDASRFGYTITQYSPTSSTVNQYGTGKRLIAVVTGNSDYHFYMQHSNGTWSHKPGSSNVTNLSLSDNSTVLTNSNILSLANSGAYAGGQLRFYIITKDAVIDKPHSSRCCDSWPCGHSQNTLYYLDQAGDYMKTSTSVATGCKDGRFDFNYNHDFYCFVPPSTGTYTITTHTNSSADIDCKIYDENGGSLYNATNTGAVNVSLSLTVGKRYFFDVYNYSKTVVTYTFSIS